MDGIASIPGDEKTQYDGAHTPEVTELGSSVGGHLAEGYDPDKATDTDHGVNSALGDF